MAVKVKQNTLEVGFIEDSFVFSGPQKQGSATDVVDLASDAFSVVKEGGDKTVTEELTFKSGDAEVVFDVSGGFLEVEGGEMIADGDALMKGVVGGEAEFVSQVRLTEQDQGQVGSGVKIVVEQEAELELWR